MKAAAMKKTRLNLEPLEDRFLPSADEVSAAISGLFGQYGSDYQALAAQSAAFHAQFVTALQNNALAATVASYEQMWAQDVSSLLPPEINSGRLFDPNTAP